MPRDTIRSVPSHDRRAPDAPRDRRSVEIPTDWQPEGREYLRDQLERLWQAVENLNEPMDRIATAIERLERMAERFEPIVKEWPHLRTRHGLMWTGLALFLTSAIGVGFFLTGQYLRNELLPAVSPLEHREAMRESILDIAPAIGVEGRIQGTGPRAGWPTVPALNRYLKRLDPAHPRVDALDRDAACRTVPERCGLP